MSMQRIKRYPNEERQYWKPWINSNAFINESVLNRTFKLIIERLISNMIWKPHFYHMLKCLHGESGLLSILFDSIGVACLYK